MIEVVYPAPLLELLGMIRELVPAKPQFTRLAMVQAGRSDAVGFVADGRMLAAIGFWPIGDGVDELYLVSRPAPEVAPHLVALVRLGRLTLTARLHSGTVAIVGFVKIGHQPGERLARLVGFRPVDDGAPSGFSRWELRDVRLGTYDLRGQLLEKGAG